MAVEVQKDAQSYHCRRCHASDTYPCDRMLEVYEHEEDREPIARFTTCAQVAITAASHFWLDLNRHFERGLLPFAGGLLDQPAAFIDAMELIRKHAG